MFSPHPRETDAAQVTEIDIVELDVENSVIFNSCRLNRYGFLHDSIHLSLSSICIHLSAASCLFCLRVVRKIPDSVQRVLSTSENFIEIGDGVFVLIPIERLLR